MNARHGLPLRRFSPGKGLATARRSAEPTRPSGAASALDAYLQGVPLGIELPVRLDADATWHCETVPVHLPGVAPAAARRVWLAAYRVLLGRYGNEACCIGFPSFADAQEPPVLRCVHDAEAVPEACLAQLDADMQEAIQHTAGVDHAVARERAQGCSVLLVDEEGDLGTEAWLALQPDRDGQGARLFLRARADAALSRMAGHLGRLALGLQESREPVGRLAWLDDAERTMLYALRGDPDQAPPVGLVHGLFEAQARRTPSRIALHAPDRSLTYAELEHASRQLAACLQARGIGREQRIGVCLPRGSDLVTGLLAVLRAGACYVPLDPAYPGERLAYMLKDADCALVLVDASTETEVAALGFLTLSVDAVAPDETPLAASAASPSDLAYLIYTSGSTGQPKGVAIEHGSAHAFLRWAGECFEAAEWREVLAATSVCFDLSIYELFGTLAWGGTVHLVENLFALADYPRRDVITLINTVPSVCAALLALGDLPESVRTVNLAGEPLRAHLVRQLRQQPGVRRILNLYGPTEDTTYSTLYELPRAGAAEEKEPSIGRPLPGTTVQVLDPLGAPVPLGVPGELYLGGVGLARGYFGKPEQTEARFLAAGRLPLAAPERLYRTGDRVRLGEDGLLEHLGRLDDQVKFNGFRIELGEIASRLATAPGVVEAVAVLAPDSAGLRRLVAYLVSEAPLDVPALAAHLARTLPHYMLPSAYLRLPALPKTLNGKIDRKALPPPPANTTDAPLDGLADPLERAVHGAWQAVLGTAPLPGQGFYAAGGDSLRAVHLLAHVRHALGRLVPLQAFAGGEATVDHLLALVRDAADVPTPDNPTAIPPRLTLAERRLWIAQHLEPEVTAYNLQARVRISGATADAVASALGRLLDRHLVLRRRIELAADGPRPVPLAVEAVPLTCLDPMDTSPREARLQALAEAAARTPFDLGREAPLRISLLPWSDATSVDLLLSVHHCAFDDMSLVVFARELLALLEGQPLPPLAAAPEQVAAWEAAELASGRPETVAARWADHLAPLLRAPDRAPADDPGSRPSGTLTVPVGPDVFQACRRLATAAGTSPFGVALDAFARTLADEQEREVLVGIALAGRSRLETHGLVSNFVNLLPLAVRVELGRGRVDSLRQVGRDLLDLVAHQDVPLETLNDALRRREVGSVPLRVACGAHTGRQTLFTGRTCRLEAQFLPSPLARLDLTLWLEEAPDGWTAVWTHARDRYEEDAVRALHACWAQHLLAGAETLAEGAGHPTHA
ncbi:non-ribosomal peptide synthetase [Pseudomonas mangiferae]|uniref:Amino acid adenylation domain-containing protein n=1 Tax=Pseudomonas mangiferae TaxID=2593654 RepID=A0A553H4Q1_9PSED|nr:non-ribosomal peptide synthetase [Pseudomonas mangiferae]TRX76742.1 amino acid adenylation domain-containing protein [Pseudomonas mangiferae]